MNEVIEKEKVNIENMIYEIRGKQVMLDSDLAKLYGTETKRINEAVRRNNEKFPERFSWVLTNEESKSFLVANCDQKSETRGGKYKNPRVFTEQGVAMLATILKTKVATLVSIAIMDAFVLMRHYISKNSLTNDTLSYKLLEHDKRISLLENTFNNFKEKNNHIFFEGQIYDAYSLMLSIFEKTEKSITIIDNYVDKKLLDLLSKTERNVRIFSSNINEELIKKYKSQYMNIEIIETSEFHDRFIIIDEYIVYHCGSSFKDLGKKAFAINLIQDEDFLKRLLERMKIIK